MFENTNGTNVKLKKDWQNNGLNKTDKRTNDDLQNTTEEIKIEQR
jgi:hypothetical protein